MNSQSSVPLLFVHKQRMGLSHVAANVLRKPVPCGPLESYIGKVHDMLEIAIQHKVYWKCKIFKASKLKSCNCFFSVPMNVQISVLDSLLTLSPCEPNITAVIIQTWLPQHHSHLSTAVKQKIIQFLDHFKDKLPYFECSGIKKLISD